MVGQSTAKKFEIFSAINIFINYFSH